jgi:hypothetical protein
VKKKGAAIVDVKEDGPHLILSTVKLSQAENVSSTTTITFQDTNLSIKKEPQEEIEIKKEPIELKIELREESEVDVNSFLGLIEENSSDSSLSRLPAYNRFFDGNRFISRSEYIESKLKISQKKRERRPEFWQSTVQKKLRNLGQQYRSIKGHLVPARKVGDPCDCRKNCATKINENNRNMNFKRYWEIENVNEKRKFLVEHIKLSKPKRALVKKRVYSRIMHHFLDVFNYDGSCEQIRVCKKMFCSTLSISNSFISNSFKVLSKEKNLEN